MNQFFHIPFLLILLAKGNTTIHSLLDQNGCKVLAVLCLKDPACGDTEVFYKKCLERLSANFEPYRNLIGFEKVLSNPVTFLSLALFPNYLNKNKDLVHSYPEHSHSNPTEHSYSNPTKVKNGKEIPESETVQHADNYQDNFLLSDASRDAKKEIVEEALGLIQKLLKKEAIKIQQKKLSTDYEKDSNKLEKVQLQYVLKLPVVKKGSKTTSSISSGKSNSVLEKVSHFSDVSDREEKAILVYSQNEEDTQKPISEDKQENYLFVYTTPVLNSSEAASLGDYLQKLLWNISAADHTLFITKQQQGNQIAYLIHPPSSLPGSANILQSVIRSINTDERLRDVIKNVSGVELISAHSVRQEVINSKIVYEKRKAWDKITLTTALICGCALTTFIVSAAVCLVKSKSKGAPVLLKKQEAVQDYQELLRTQMSIVNLPKPDDKITEKEAGMRQTWSEESMAYNMDISTGHVILAYMEDHLKNDNRLNKEWEALCNYRSDDSAATAGSDIKNALKNRYRDVLPYDHSRVKLNAMSNALHSDYINANFITDIRDAEYIATQGPLHNTISDFWQMIWEQGVVIIVNLTRLSDMGLPQCHRYWPEDGSEIYHIYEVHLISEHIWCDDYLVRSLYLKNMQTSETRTVTQFHYLTWPDLSVPASPKPLLDFRRKVNKCYRGHARPIVVHCNNGVGRTGTYILLDMILNKMIKGAKEIDIAAALEHLRDQRPDMVKTKGQFDFSLTAMAEEVTAILSSISR